MDENDDEDKFIQITNEPTQLDHYVQFLSSHLTDDKNNLLHDFGIS